MADYENLFADEDFIVDHLFDSPENFDLSQSFSVGNAAMGLEIFLKEAAEQEKFVQNHVKPKYDEGCIFMYQPL